MSLAKKYFETKMNRINRYIDAGKNEKAKDEVADLVGFAAYTTCKGITFRTIIKREYPKIFDKAEKHSDLLSLVNFDEFLPDSLTRADEDDKEMSLDDFLSQFDDDEEEDEDEEDDDLDTCEETDDEEDVTALLKRIFGKRS